MPFDISFLSMQVLIDGHDSEGRLLLADGQLVAVIVRLDGEAHSVNERGSWHLEAGFGKCHIANPPLFKTPEEAGAWVERTLRGEAG